MAVLRDYPNRASVAYQLMAGVVVIAIGMTPIGIWRLRRMDLVDKVKNLTQ